MKVYFSSNLFRKTLSALTGLFLVIFLIGHLLGNLQLIIYSGEVAQKKFNEYAFFMTTNPFVKILSFLTYGSVIIHTFVSIFLAIKSKKARPISYEVKTENQSSTWSSRNMPLLGMLILFFIIIHKRSFWYEMHFGSISYDVWGNKDLYKITMVSFKEFWYSAFYVFSMVIIGIHLSHGIESGFQTLGIKNKKLSVIIHNFSVFFAFFLSFIFALIPIIIYIRS